MYYIVDTKGLNSDVKLKSVVNLWELLIQQVLTLEDK